MRLRPRALAGPAIVALLAVAGPSPAAYLREYPRPGTIVEFHPRGDRPFAVAQLERALREGVHAAELDLAWRPSDGKIVCAHRSRDLARAPTLDDAWEAIVRHAGRSATVQSDGRQFFLVLDLKDESAGFHRALVSALAARASRLSTAARPPDEPRGITVLISGFRAALERDVPAERLDTLCLIEGRVYGARMRNLSDGDGRFQWVALDAPVERDRVRDLHEGRDSRFRGRFNVRIVAAHDLLERAFDSGADAVNADPEEVPAALRAAARAAAAGARAFGRRAPAP